MTRVIIKMTQIIQFLREYGCLLTRGSSHDSESSIHYWRSSFPNPPTAQAGQIAKTAQKVNMYIKFLTIIQRARFRPSRFIPFMRLRWGGAKTINIYKNHKSAIYGALMTFKSLLCPTARWLEFMFATNMKYLPPLSCLRSITVTHVFSVNSFPNSGVLEKNFAGKNRIFQIPYIRQFFTRNITPNSPRTWRLAAVQSFHDVLITLNFFHLSWQAPNPRPLLL